MFIRKKEVLVKKLFAIFFLFLALAALASADVYIKSKTHTDAFSIMGQSQPAKDETTEQWFGDDKFIFITPELSFIVDLKKNVLNWVNNGQKTYIETELPFDFAKIAPPEMAPMMSQMMKMTVIVTPNGQTKTIGQWDCSGYDVSMQMMMMQFKISVWATTNVPFDLDKFAKMYSNVQKALWRIDDAAVQEMMKIKGYWIAFEMTAEIMGAQMRSTSEVIEIAKKTPEASVYTVPAGYTKQDKLSMQDIQRR
jgi:hypothetical protein